MSTAEQDTHPLTASLRALAHWLDEHPGVDVYSIVDRYGEGIDVHNYQAQDGKSLAELARAIGGRWEKVDSDGLFTLRREVAEGVRLELSVLREQVCEMVVTDRVEEVEEPDPDAVAALPKVRRTVTVQDREWKCPDSLLALTGEGVTA